MLSDALEIKAARLSLLSLLFIAIALYTMRSLHLSTLTFAALPVAGRSPDYVIVGAGTSGLVVANRLSEDPRVTVVVIEPGTDQRTNPNVTDTDKFQSAFNTEIDWAYPVIAQPEAGNQTLVLHQGKAWGGTSAINGKFISLPECALLGTS